MIAGYCNKKNVNYKRKQQELAGVEFSQLAKQNLLLKTTEKRYNTKLSLKKYLF